MKDNVYRRQVEFVINASAQQYRAYCILKYTDPSETYHWDVWGSLHTYENEKDGSIVCVVWLRRFDPKHHFADIGVLVHEVQHLVFKVMRDKGVDASRASEEAWAYLFEFYVSTFLDAFIPSKKKKKRK